MLPNTNRLLLLRDFLRACANLAGKSLPPDPAVNTSATLAALGVTGGVSGIDGGIGSTPQYVPILPKPPTTTMLVTPHPGVDITASSSGYVVAASGSTSSNILANTVIYPFFQLDPFAFILVGRIGFIRHGRKTSYDNQSDFFTPSSSFLDVGVNPAFLLSF